MLTLINKKFVINKGVGILYRIVGPEDSNKIRGNKIWGICAIKIQDRELPAIDRLYLVPAQVTNHLGITRRMLATCNPMHQRVSAPFYFITKERQFVEAEEEGFIDSKLGYSLTHHTLYKDSVPEQKLYLKSCAGKMNIKLNNINSCLPFSTDQLRWFMLYGEAAKGEKKEIL